MDPPHHDAAHDVQYLHRDEDQQQQHADADDPRGVLCFDCRGVEEGHDERVGVRLEGGDGAAHGLQVRVAGVVDVVGGERVVLGGVRLI